MLAKMYRDKLDAEAKMKAQEALLADYQKKIQMLEAKVQALLARMPEDETESDDPIDKVGVVELMIEAERRKVKNYEGGLGLEELTKDWAEISFGESYAKSFISS